MATEYKLFYEKTDGDGAEVAFGNNSWDNVTDAERHLRYENYMLWQDGDPDRLLIRSREVGDWT